MEFIDVCILILAFAIVFCVIRYQIIKKRSDKSGACKGACSACNNCPMGGNCGQISDKSNDKDES